ncbi:MAG TPA: 1-(5-phosphoribosyl)-5-[(5-phosphoribosylamino)methylideneamino] imidazole-4-carboxamide isomerase [Bacteroidota bacterium]|nr:1-(5-phosphoribosyl)-5-[(5-phosphoribosylamino)methylideneamino] imidazole-4-carboxamide isomerase [Bacteroidota bacterium]
MILIYPLIEISKSRCIEIVHGAPGSEHRYSVDPVHMALLWRGENAKTIHVIDRDGAAEGRIVNDDIIRQLVEAVDIPIQVSGGLRTYEEIQRVLNLGVYRIILNTAAVEKPEIIEEFLKEFGSRKIAVGIVSEAGKVVIKGGTTTTQISPLELALQMAEIGISRIVYGEREKGEIGLSLPYEMLKEIALKTGVRVTARGGVWNYKDLVRLQSLEKIGVDSVILGKPLYENCFPCQTLWRLNEQQLVDLGPTRRL